MSPRPIVACDLDRTLIYSKNSLWLTGEDKDAPAMVVAEVYQGAPLSYMTRTAEELLRAVKSLATFVPATTRTQAQYERVQLPGPPSEWAVTSNGGVILHHGVPDAVWKRHLGIKLGSGCAPLADMEKYLSNPDFAPWILRLRHAEDLFVYAIVDRDAMPEDFLTELTELCARSGWSVSVQGRKLYCVPLPVNKADAVSEVARRTDVDHILAAGDSLLDKEMMKRADLAFRPRHGELHDAGFMLFDLHVTAVRGILAGEEILAKILDELPA